MTHSRYPVDQNRLKEWLKNPVHHIIKCTDATYPPLLNEIPDPPDTLYMVGNPALCHQPQLAIVGSRNPSHYGKANAAAFSTAASQAGLTITSGMALGIDAIAHRTALQHLPSTIAVLGCGLDVIYPTRHTQLFHAIADSGLLISEYPLGVRPHAAHFPQRNRIISGLALGTLVIEASLRSGSLITAHRAADQNRPVFVIPGMINNPLARGCHALINEGAKLVESIDEICVELAPLGSAFSPRKQENDFKNNKIEKITPANPILKAMGVCPISLESLHLATGQSFATLAELLLDLELKGVIIRCDRGLYQRVV